MMKIVKSLITIAAVAAIAVGTTSAYFSSSARIDNNKFSTGNLEIWVDGASTVTEAEVENMVPGTPVVSEVYTYTHSTTSTVDATKLALSVAKDSTSDDALYNVLTLKVEMGEVSPTTVVYNGLLKDFTDQDIITEVLAGANFAPGDSIKMQYTVELPDSGNQNGLQTLMAAWDFVMEARTS